MSNDTGVSGYGTKLEYSPEGYEQGAWTELENIIEVSPPQLSISSITKKTMKAPNQAVQKKPSWKETGDVSVSMYYDGDQMETLYAMAGVMQGWRVTLADDATIMFDGFISNIGEPADIDDEVKIEFTITPSGLPVFAK